MRGAEYDISYPVAFATSEPLSGAFLFEGMDCGGFDERLVDIIERVDISDWSVRRTQPARL